MSKKNKRKFAQQQSQMERPAQAVAPAAMQRTTASSVTAAMVNNTISANRTHNVMSGHSEEYAVIRMDLIKVVVLNILFLAGVLALYYSNLHSQYLERWFGSILHF